MLVHVKRFPCCLCVAIAIACVLLRTKHTLHSTHVSITAMLECLHHSKRSRCETRSRFLLILSNAANWLAVLWFPRLLLLLALQLQLLFVNAHLFNYWFTQPTIKYYTVFRFVTFWLQIIAMQVQFRAFRVSQVPISSGLLVFLPYESNRTVLFSPVFSSKHSIFFLFPPQFVEFHI